MSFYAFIPKLFNMSLTASVAIVFVLLLRLMLKKAPKVISYALWAVVLFRLLCPVSIESSFSLFGLMDAPTTEGTALTTSIAYVPENIVHAEYPAVTLPVPGVSDAINDALPSGREQLVADPLEAPVAFATYVWIIGVLVMAAYSLASYRRLRQKLLTASPLRDNIYLADEITSPFVMGLVRPKIYLPSDMEEQEQDYILRHEQHHIRRGDHIIKALAFLALSIHWFNPLVWVAFIYSSKDMEMSCDEAVVKKMGAGILADYTASLLSLATGKHIIAGMPLAFGEGDTKGRIRNLANWRKPAFWVVLIAVITCIALAVGLMTNPAKEDGPDSAEGSYFLLIGDDGVESIEISGVNTSGGVVNADGSAFSKGEKVWLEPLEGIRDLRGISITALGADGEILYLLSVPECFPDAEVINMIGSDSWLLTPGNLVHMGKTYVYEKVGFPDSFAITLYPDGTFTYYEGMLSSYIGVGSWTQTGDIIAMTDDGPGGYGFINHFKLDGEDLVFVAQNSSNFTYVQVADGERFHHTEATISHTGGVTDPNTKQRLSLNDVIILSQKGYDLTWSDFEDFSYIETGSGLYIRVYEINEMFELWIGGSGPDSDLMYIYLALADDLDTRIDIRDGGVTEFIGADHSEVLLTNAIYDAILEHNKPSEPDGLYHCASFVQMNRAEICIDSDPPSPIKVVVYGLALHQAFSFPDGHLRDEAGSHIPVKLAFAIENGVYTLLEYWEPRDGSYYAQDIRDEFPDAVEEDALDTQKYIVGQVQSCYDQAVRYGGIDPASVIENLLEVIASSPAHSSNPSDYIEEHAIEYRKLTYYGRYTLQYCFGKFLQGKQTGLTGHIMALACQDIMLGWGEAYAMDQELMTGQEWFEEFRSNAGSLVEQYSNEELESLYPGAWLLLQMESLCGYPLAAAQEVSMEVVKIDPNKIMTEPTDGFGAIVPKEWVERDSEMLIPVPEEDTDPNFSMPADGKAKGKTQIQIAPDP